MILTTLVLAVCLGILAQTLASQLKMPAILPLLLLGIAAGPSGLGLFEPASLGGTLEALIHLGVAVILFEGGLSLDPRRLRKVQGAVRNLLTIGVVVSGVGGALLAHYLVGMSWQTAALFGAIVTVTGPTVIAPLLRHTIAPRPVKTILLSEGLIIDGIGALLAYLALQYIERQGMPMAALGQEVIKVTATGLILGFVGGAIGKSVISSRRFDAELSHLITFALLMLMYWVAEGQAEQSGILAAVVMGFTLSSSRLPDMGGLRDFKEHLTTLLISVLFVLLSGQLRLEEILGLGWNGALVAVGLIFVVRPLSVFLSVWPNHLGLKERFFLAMTAPRGIVAAAVASLGARELHHAGVEGGSLLEGLVYLSILATGAWATLMSVALPIWLGYRDDRSRKRAIVIGAHPLAEVLVSMVRRSGRTTVVVDSSSWRLDKFRRQNLETVRGDARDAGTFEKAGVESDSMVIAATTNDELNLLIGELVHHDFDVHHPVVALQVPPEDLGRRSRAWIDVLSDRGVEIPRWNRLLEENRAEVVEIPWEEKRVRERIRDLAEEKPKELLVLGAWKGESLSLRVSLGPSSAWDSLTLLVSEGEAKQRILSLLEELAQEAEEPSAEDPNLLDPLADDESLPAPQEP
ncbi:MAG: cation:proton antiporter [Deltaproteobacteria bacterium]|nr:cation:proton antiporter [Deltaproteobacteria bacterium]